MIAVGARSWPAPQTPWRVGIDFDNTIVCYDAVFRAVAIERGLIPRGFSGSKQEIRDAVRRREGGEADWQRLQGHVYGRGIADAALFDGLETFLHRCHAVGHTVFVVSHKTEFGHFDPARINLRDAAREWMRRHGFFAEDGFAIPETNVFFEGTRADKLARIAALGCTHFIDDLEEVLDDPSFPPGVEPILFSPRAQGGAARYAVHASWESVAADLFHAGA